MYTKWSWGEIGIGSNGNPVPKFCKIKRFYDMYSCSCTGNGLLSAEPIHIGVILKPRWYLTWSDCDSNTLRFSKALFISLRSSWCTMCHGCRLKHSDTILRAARPAWRFVTSGFLVSRLSQSEKQRCVQNVCRVLRYWHRFFITFFPQWLHTAWILAAPALVVSMLYLFNIFHIAMRDTPYFFARAIIGVRSEV